MPSLKITSKVSILVVILACNTVWSVADTNPSSDQHIHIAGSQSVMVGDEPDADTDSEQRLKAKNIIDRLLQNYTRQNSPHGDKPTTVQLGIYINSFYSISEQTMDYSVNIYLRQEWFDPRLQYNKSEIGRNKDCVKLEDKIWEKLWVPDVFFRNEKKADFHHVTIPNRFINLYPSGKLWYVMKISATLSCMMQLQKYPLDTQICPMMLESFGHTMKTVVFKWLVNKSVESTDELSMPQFVLIGYPTRDCSKNYTTGSYPCLQVDFILRRDIGYFIIQVYIPTVLIVILSWVAFWINTKRYRPGSVLDCSQSPMSRADSLNHKCPITNERSAKLTDILSQPQQLSGRIENYSRIPPVVMVSRASKIDKIARRLFPLSFLLFNVIYWVMYAIVK
uniref:Gamma-aminobutyric acid receptor subunit beta n=1 Tax=Macrostomum lignano TaxID=282301 RepID=A0A1I8I862_9PLAT